MKDIFYWAEHRKFWTDYFPGHGHGVAYEDANMYNHYLPRLDKLLPFGWSIQLHKFIGEENAYFHTHQANIGVRVILRNGYVEEVLLPDGEIIRRVWKTGNVGIIRADYCHRFVHTLEGKPCITAWIRGRTRHDVYHRWPGRVSTVVRIEDTL